MTPGGQAGSYAPDPGGGFTDGGASKNVGDKSGLRTALAGLTTRGRSFLAAGIAAGICAYVLGQSDLLRVGLLLAALPLVCAGVLYRTRYRVAGSRKLSPRAYRRVPRHACTCAWTTSPGCRPAC